MKVSSREPVGAGVALILDYTVEDVGQYLNLYS